MEAHIDRDHWVSSESLNMNGAVDYNVINLSRFLLKSLFTDSELLTSTRTGRCSSKSTEKPKMELLDPEKVLIIKGSIVRIHYMSREINIPIGKRMNYLQPTLGTMQCRN